MRTRYFSVLSILALAGCVEAGPEYENSDKGLTAIIDCGVASTKAILVDNPGVRMQAKWQEGDCIGVFGNAASNIKFTIAPSAVSEDGKTAKFDSPSGIPSGNLVALSPYQEGTSSASGTIYATFPAKQSYCLNDGVVQPDPAANIMMGSGSAATGITFCNVLSVLKIGQVFDAATTVRSIEFRDISGNAVSGAMTIKWNDGGPLAEITGSGSTVTLDCGDGVSLDKDQLGIFYIIVPARTYAKGFELTFITDSGEKTVKTVGTAMGKTLDRSVVYMIGDISSKEYAEGASSQLKATAQLMTAGKMEMVKVLSSTKTILYDENGKAQEDSNGNSIVMPQFTLLVHKDLNPVEGGWLVFEEQTDDLPGGGVYKIVSCKKNNDDYYEVYAKPDINPAAAFESVSAGLLPTVDASGNIVEMNGLPLDIASNIKSIVDESGNERYIRTNAAGELQFTAQEMQDMVDAATKANKANKPHSTILKSPKLSANLKGDNAELSLGAQMSFDTRLALGVMQGELQYACLTINPQITISQSLTLKSEINLDKSFRLFTLTTHPILVAPGIMVVVEIVFNATLGVGGDLQITASSESATDLGTYSVSYNKGDGVIFRNKPMSGEVPGSCKCEISGIQGSAYGKVTLGARSSAHIWATCGLGVNTEFSLKCGLFSDESGKKLALKPEMEFTPIISTFFRSWEFKNLSTKVEFDPIWEKCITPAASPTLIVRYKMSENYYELCSFSKNGITQDLTGKVPTGISGIRYNIKLEGECLSDVKLALLVYKCRAVNYVCNDSEDSGGEALKAFRAAGVEHLYDWYYWCSSQPQNRDREPSQILEIGTYEKDTESQTYEGICTLGQFTSGQVYQVAFALGIGDNYQPVGEMTDPFIFWWPNRSNGTTY